MYRIPSPIKDAVKQLAESYRQGLWDGRFESLKIGQKQPSIALIRQMEDILADHATKLQSSCNCPETKKLIEELRIALSSDQLPNPDIDRGRNLVEKTTVER